MNELITFLDTVDSTNNYAMATIRAGTAKHKMAFVAKEQTAGKAQRGKTWQMQAGQSIAMSIIVKTDTLKIETPYCLNMLIALAAHDFLKRQIANDVFIKWPNDLYWRNKKLGGILIENVFSGTKWKWAVVGVGINVNQIKFNKLLPNPVSIKQITNNDYDINELVNLLYKLILQKIDTLTTTPTNKILKEYNKQLYKLNTEVKLKKATAVFITTIKGVSINGQLLTKDIMERQFNFGEVTWVL